MSGKKGEFRSDGDTGKMEVRNRWLVRRDTRWDNILKSSDGGCDGFRPHLNAIACMWPGRLGLAYGLEEGKDAERKKSWRVIWDGNNDNNCS